MFNKISSVASLFNLLILQDRIFTTIRFISIGPKTNNEKYIQITIPKHPGSMQKNNNNNW